MISGVNPPAFSVVIPTHRRPELLAAALRSVAAQAFPRGDFDVIVVATAGDVAYDVVPKVAAETALNVRCVSVPDDPSGGRSAAAKRNYGGQLAAGEWLAFLDDDCVADPVWLAEGAKCFAPGVGAVEGAKRIPPPPRPTPTYVGMKSFETPGGFQSCNMFYRRAAFLAVGGFDTRFPFYLEDTDLAWTFEARFGPIPHAAAAIVRHPVPSGAPWRLLEDARRTALHALLRRKHPAAYRRNGWRVLSKRHIAYLVLLAAVPAAAITFGWVGAAAAFLILAAVTAADVFRQSRGLEVRRDEVLVPLLILPYDAAVRLTSFLRGSVTWRHAERTVPPLADLSGRNPP